MPSICQVSGCTNSQFTYCPHCSLNICINCLNEHYLFMENDYKQYLFNFQTELNINHQQIRDEQYQISKRLSNVIQYNRFENFLTDKIDRNGKLIMKHFQPSDYLELKQNFTFLVENHQKFNQLIQQINQLIADFEGNSRETRTSNSLESISTTLEINVDNTSHVPKSESVLTIEPDDDESSEDPSSIWDLKSFIKNHMSHIHTTSTTPVYHNDDLSMKQNLDDEIYTARQLKQMTFSCPLIKYKFGLQQHHCQLNGITNIPCDSSEEKQFCLFTHLHHYHVLNTSSALKIIRALIYLPNHLNQIDLFSNESIDSLIGNMILSYTGVCPLIKHGVYGILPEHQIKLCNKIRRKKILLHYHIRITHRIAHQYATRLVRAIINNIDEKIPIIKANEQIILLRRKRIC